MIGHHRLASITPDPDRKGGQFDVVVRTGPPHNSTPWLVLGRYRFDEQGLTIRRISISGPRGKVINSATISGISVPSIQRLIHKALNEQDAWPHSKDTA